MTTKHKGGVGYLGPDRTTFGYAAAVKFFGDTRRTMVPLKSHTLVIDAVAKNEITSGVVAIENSIDGHVSETVHAMEDSHRKLGVKVCGEIELPIEMLFLRKRGAEGEPAKVFSHPVAIRQCSKFVTRLQESGVTVEVLASTGEAAKEAASNPDLAVLASPLAEKHYDLVRVQEGSVADHLNNKTRFWVVGHKLPNPSGNDKTCILVNLDQEKSGVLHKAIGFFAERDICILCVYPNPIPGRSWEYTFVIEVKGHIFDQNIDQAYSSLRDSGIPTPGGSVVLGSYPSATHD